MSQSSHVVSAGSKPPVRSTSARRTSTAWIAKPQLCACQANMSRSSRGQISRDSRPSGAMRVQPQCTPSSRASAASAASSVA